METIAVMEDRQNEAGFTLVELAVVLIIIGLLVGGILKEQELIESSRIKATISQIEGIRAAVQGFRDRYGAYPGDISDPLTRLPECTAAPCKNGGDNNGKFANLVKDAPSKDAEGVNAFVHLAAAGFLTGIEPEDANPEFGQNLPAAKVGGGYWFAYGGTGANPTGLTLRAGPYLVLNGDIAAPGGTTGALTASEAAQIDRALDDGNPTSGSIYAAGTDCQSSGVYNEGNENSLCSLLIGF